MLSIIIPSRNEKYLAKTIDNVLENARGEIEIIAICDGYWPDPPIQDNPSVVLLHHSEARGQRQSINEAAMIAKGEYLMKLDAHCAVAPGFDVVLAEDYQPGWTVVPRMYNLDVETWEPKLNKRTDYMYIGMHPGHELRPEYYEYKEYKGEEYRKLRQPDNNKEIDETMCCMGPGWFISADQFWVQGGCDESHGSWGQQSVEVALKAWLSGNALMVNKKTWFAHWFRGDEGFPYPIKGSDIEKARQYSRDLWLNNKWDGQVRDLKWLFEKFNPPGWENIMADEKQLELNSAMYAYIHREGHEPYYRGVRLIKMPTDMEIYHEVIWENKPKWIIETGTKFGGSALFLQDQLDLVGEGGRVVTIDIGAVVENPDPRILYIKGSSIDRAIVAHVKEIVGNDTCMVSLDSNHARKHVKWELYYYGPMVTPGQYLVVEDCHTRSSTLYGPGQARDWFLTTRMGRNFTQTNLDKRFLVGICLGGWLRRK